MLGDVVLSGECTTLKTGEEDTACVGIENDEDSRCPDFCLARDCT